MDSRIAFVHGRPAAHPAHTRFAQRVGADFHFTDGVLPLRDGVGGFRLRRYLSWLLSAYRLSARSEYSVILSEGPQFPLGLMKWLRLLRSKGKTVALLDNETLYFLREQRYSWIVSLAYKRLLGTYDALICVGEMETLLAKEILGAECPPIYRVIHGVPEARRRGLDATRPRLEGSNIMFCAHGPGGWRLWYKGLDIMLRAFWMSHEKCPELRLYVVGEWDRSAVEELLMPRRLEKREAVVFTGRQDCLGEWLTRSALYLHCGRGDAYAISVLEAMCAGVVPIVSEWTGAREVVERVSGDLVVPLDAEAISERILWYFGLDDSARRGLSDRCREIISEFTEEAADRRFEEAFGRMAKDLRVEWVPLRRSIAR